jgi:hypothetical protein
MRSIDVAPITGTGETEPNEVIDLDPRAEVRFLNTDDDFGFVLADGGVEVVVSLPRHPDAERLVRSLAARIEQLIPEVRRATIGYGHGPLTGPVPWPRS